MVNVNNLVTLDISEITRTRLGEVKIGQKVANCHQNSLDELLQDPGKRFVILGIQEDIGVRANFGRRGAHTAFLPALESFLNQQSNSFFSGDEVIVAGSLYTDDLMRDAEHLNPRIPHDLEVLRRFTSEIDQRLSPVISKIVGANKIPVVIGGGHNNAYGNIKGTSEVLSQPIHAINCDPHTDFRQTEGRHSGNGFSYAFEHDYLNRYAVLGLHEAYNNAFALEAFQQHSNKLFFQSFESVFVREELNFHEALMRCIGFVKEGPCGVEIDLDSVSNVPSSAKTSSGITTIQARRFVHMAATHLNSKYLHVAEAAPILAHKKADNKTGKLISYIITDFMKAVLAK
jgi:formiminoglutamase